MKLFSNSFQCAIQNEKKKLTIKSKKAYKNKNMA